MPFQDGTPSQELDVRPLRKPDKHPTIFGSYAELAVGGSFVLINDHDPKHLREEFEADHADSYRWEYLNTEPRDWRIRITKLTTTPLPRILTHTDLDANIIALPPAGSIDAHDGPALDVLIHVVAGSGRLTTEQGDLDLRPGALLWLPRRSRRQFTAGPDGLRYLTIHQRRQALTLGPSRPAATG